MYIEWILESCSLISSLYFWQRHTQNQPKRLSPDGPMGLPESPNGIRITRWIRWEEDSSERQSSESWDARGIARLAGIACMGIIEHGAKLAANRKPHFRWLGGYVPRRWMGKQVLLQFRLQLQSPAKALASCECPCLLSHHSRWLFARGDQGYKIYQHVFFGTFGILDCILEVLFSVYLSEKSCGIALPPPKKSRVQVLHQLGLSSQPLQRKTSGHPFFRGQKKRNKAKPRAASKLSKDCFARRRFHVASPTPKGWRSKKKASFPCTKLEGWKSTLFPIHVWLSSCVGPPKRG